MFSGGAIERLSIFALGVMPYISASIIIQMMAVVVPSLAAIKKEGESGRRKLTQYTRYGTVLLAAVQGSSAAIALQNQGVVIKPGPQFVFVATVTLIAGTMFLMWLGEQITERGLGNGISMIILAGIVAGLPAAVAGTLELVRTGELNPAFALILFGMVIAVTAFVVFVERGQRRIQVNYAKRQQGRKLYAGQSTHLPFKLNMSGVIPPIFASSLLLFPATIASWSGTSQGWSWLQNVVGGTGTWSAGAHDAVRGADHFLLLLLHRAGVQLARDGGEPEEVGRLHSGYPAGPADRRVHRQGADAPDGLGRPVRDDRVLVARVSDFALQRAVLLRRHVAADHGGRDHGFSGPGRGASDVASVRGPDEEGQPARLRSPGSVLIPERLS